MIRTTEHSVAVGLARFHAPLLWLAALGLVPIALSYGLVPRASLPLLFDIDASGVNTRHVFRAIMGLYLALAGFWIMGALRPHLRIAALMSLTVFMLGLGVGRLLSILVDGWPHPLLVAYTGLEFGLGFAAWKLLSGARGVR
jgi:hypothetical protein